LKDRFAHFYQNPHQNLDSINILDISHLPVRFSIPRFSAFVNKPDQSVARDILHGQITGSTQPLLGFIIGRAIPENQDLPSPIRQCLHGSVGSSHSGSMTLKECLAAAHAAVRSMSFLAELRAILAVEPAASSGQRRRKVRRTEEEDHRLVAAIHRSGIHNSPTIALFAGTGRTKSQCAQQIVTVA
jgi:hypothetical protein